MIDSTISTDHDVKNVHISGEVGKLTIQKWFPKREAKRAIFLLPNGYGLLPYAQSLASQLANRGHTVYSMDARGQGASDGQYSVRGAAEDIKAVFSTVNQWEQQFDVLVHCSAALSLILLGRNSAVWHSVKSVLLYCYLADPQAHLARFRLKCARYGVRLAEDVGRLDCYGPDAYRAIPVPMAIVHPRLPANLRRASVQQVRELARLTGASHFETPATGYNINTRPQKSAIRETVERDFAPLLE